MTHEPISRLSLERLALGDLPADEASALEARIAADADLAARAARIRADITRSSEAMPPLDLDRAANVLRTAGMEELRRDWFFRQWERGRLWPMLLAVGAAATLAVVFLQPAPAPEVPVEQFRGSFDLEVFLIRDGAATPQGALITARAGDRIQWTVTPGSAGVFQVFDVQDDGVVSAFGRPRDVHPMQSFDGAMLLDDYAGAERLYFVLSDEPIGTNAVRAIVERKYNTPIADLDPMPGLQDATQRSVLISRAAE